jgi:hypothetical protein
MSSRVLRLYVFAATMLVFFVLWAVIATKPWARAASSRAAPDPRLAALDRRQHRLAREAGLVKQQLDRRWREYRQRLRLREVRIRTLEQRHAQQVAAAARAASATSSSAYSSVGAPASTAAAQVVTLPPQVRVVTLPPAAAPATSSGSSHP